MRYERRMQAVIVLLLTILVAPRCISASETADAISLAAGGASLTHAALSFIVPNPVTPVTSFIYGCVGFGATIYGFVTDPPPLGAPVISQVVAGPATDFNHATGEYEASGAPLTEAPAGRVVSLQGTNFSFVQRENVVLFNGKAVPTSILASNTLVSTLVPRVEGPLPAVVQLQIVVNGVPSAPVSFTILPPPSTGGPSTETWMGQAKTLSQRTRDFDWEALMDIEAPDLTASERAMALFGAQQMVRGSQRTLLRLTQFESRLAQDPALRTLADAVMGINPEIQALTLAALNALGTPTGPPSIAISDTQPPTISLTATRTGPPMEIDSTVQDTGTGLSEVSVLRAENVTVDIPPFTPGTTGPVVVTATKVDPAKPARVDLLCMDNSCNDATGDPIVNLTLRERGKPVEEVFSGIPQEEGKVTLVNGNPGVTNLLVTVNQARFRVAALRGNETRTLDVSQAMIEGERNTITLTASGKPGGEVTVLIHD